MRDTIIRIGVFGAGMAALYFIAEHWNAGGSMLAPAGLACLCLAAMLFGSRVLGRALCWAALLAIPLGALAIAAGPAAAAVPDTSFGATVMGAEHSVIVTLWNVVWWTLKVAVIGGLMMYILSRPRIRDRLTASEYNEAVALRRRYVGDGGGAPAGERVQMSVGEAIYIVGIVSLDKLVALVLTVLAVTAGAAI